MPLTIFQRQVLALLAPNRAPDSYIAGGTALHFKPNSTRYSRDVDIFHDSLELVAEAFSKDSETLRENGCDVDVRISQPGFVRAVVSREQDATQIDWAQESTWRFMPVVRDEIGGFLLHEIDLATNKVLALAGRNEPRDFVDTLYVIDNVLPLGPLVWASVDKDPGFSPSSLLEMIRRRGRFRPEDFQRLDLVAPLDPVETKNRWLSELDDAEAFVESRPPDEVGCLYYSPKDDRFVMPDTKLPLDSQDVVRHYGRPGGVLPAPPD
jgi:hypothetical protein